MLVILDLTEDHVKHQPTLSSVKVAWGTLGSHATSMMHIRPYTNQPLTSQISSKVVVSTVQQEIKRMKEK